MIEHCCIGCKEWKPEEDFNRDSTKPSGLRGRCKECNRKRCAVYRKAMRAERGERKQRTTEAAREEEARRLTSLEWFRDVQPNVAFGRAVIGGRYV